MKLLKGSLLMKALALAAAIATYYFIHTEMYRVEEKSIDPSYRLLKLTAKKLPLKVRLGTEPPDGYALEDDQVVANPPEVMVIGPEALLSDALSAETSLVDISETTKSVIKRVPIESVAGIHLAGDPYYVQVTIPIRKVESEPEPGPETP